MLGACYLMGNGVAKSDEVGMMWIRKAADQNDPVALNVLASCYLKGIGVLNQTKRESNI